MTRRGAAWIWHRKLTHQEAAPDRRGVSCLRLPRLKRRTIAIMLVTQCACDLLFSDVSIFYFSRCKTLEYSLHGDNDVCTLATRPPMAVVPAVPKSANVVSISADTGAYPDIFVQGYKHTRHHSGEDGTSVWKLSDHICENITGTLVVAGGPDLWTLWPATTALNR